MRLLYLAYRFPFPPDKGERIRMFHQIRSLAVHAELHLVCPVFEEPPAPALAAMSVHCASISLVPGLGRAALMREAGRLLAGAPRMTGTFNSRALRRAVEAVATKHAIDRVFVSTLHVAEAARALRGPGGMPDVPIVVDLVDVYSQLWLDSSRYAAGPVAWLSRIEGRRLRRYEALLAGEMDAVVLSSEAEARYFAQTVSDAPAAVVGNGVDLEYFDPAAARAARDACDRAAARAARDMSAARTSGSVEPLALESTGGAEIVFTGQMDYLPNVDAVRFFCTDVLPELRERHPRVRFSIVGRNPTRQVRALAGVPGVRVTGAVPDVRPHLSNAAVAVVPLRIARGVQNKVLEAMAMAVPVVATSAALAGLAPDCDGGVRRADDAPAFVAEIDALLGDADWRRRCGAAARHYVERHHRWEEHGRLLLDVIRNVHVKCTAAGSGRREAAAGPGRREAAAAAPAKGAVEA